MASFVNKNVPILGLSACSGTGKTTLLVKLIPLMKLQGLRVALIKQTHHDFEIDQPGKDSFELRKAGANQVLLTSNKRSALITEHDDEIAQSLYQRINELDLSSLDLILVEGFKRESFPKIELHRSTIGNDLTFTKDKSVIAVASDKQIETGKLPLLNINVPEEVAGFINRWMDGFGGKNVRQCA